MECANQEKRKLSKSEAIDRLRDLQKAEEQLLLVKGVTEKQKKETEAQLKEFARRNKILFLNKKEYAFLGPKRTGRWEFNPIQSNFFSEDGLYNPNYWIHVLTGGNRFGKTFSTVCAFITAIYGKMPWNDSEPKNNFLKIRKWEYPLYMTYVGPTTQQVRSVFEKEWNNLAPSSREFRIERDSSRAIRRIVDVETGSTLDIKTNEMEMTSFEGTSNHIVMFDEPPRREIFDALIRGVGENNGIIIFSCTLGIDPTSAHVDEWVQKDIIDRTVVIDGVEKLDPGVNVIKGLMKDNFGYGHTEEEMMRAMAFYDEDVYKARVLGEPLYMKSRILPINKNIHLIDRFPIPSHWPVDVMIDVHTAKEQHILFRAVDERDVYYDIFEVIGHGDGDWIAEQIIQKKMMYNLRINRVGIDPLAKADRNNTITVYDKVEMGLERHGIHLETATKDKRDGIIRLRDMLKSQNGMPYYYIFNDLVATIKQYIYWSYDENGIPKKENDHQCENSYRLALLGTKYFERDDKNYEQEVIEYERRMRSRDRVTGY